MALKQVLKSGEREGGAEEGWIHGSGKITICLEPRPVLLFKQEHCHVILWQTWAIICHSSLFSPPFLLFTHPLLFPHSFYLPLLCPSLSLSPSLSFSPAERRVSSEYELDYSSVPPTPPLWYQFLPFHWFGFRQTSRCRRLRMKTCQK